MAAQEPTERAPTPPAPAPGAAPPERAPAAPKQYIKGTVKQVSRLATENLCNRLFRCLMAAPW
jgi:hypothetical protein